VESGKGVEFRRDGEVGIFAAEHHYLNFTNATLKRQRNCLRDGTEVSEQLAAGTVNTPTTADINRVFRFGLVGCH
jgi:hypothetical protein